LGCGFFIYHYWCEAQSKSEKQPANLSIVDEAWQKIRTIFHSVSVLVKKSKNRRNGSRNFSFFI